MKIENMDERNLGRRTRGRTLTGDRRGFLADDSGQAATEYLLLVAVGLAILVVAVSVVLELRGISDTVADHVRTERAEAIEMLVR